MLKYEVINTYGTLPIRRGELNKEVDKLACDIPP